MKPAVTLFVCCALIAGSGCSNKITDLAGQEDKESYSLGYRFGENMKYQGAELDLEVYLSGVRDGLEGRKPRLPQEEIRATIAGLQQRLGAAQQKSQKELAEKNQAEGRAFLEENAMKDGIRTLPSGLQYKVLQAGAGKTVPSGGSVTVHYRGTFINGTEFESSFGRGVPPTFQVEGLIPGWTEALKLMREGDRWQIFLPHQLAYGEKGSPPAIPPNCTLIFEIELISVK